jgi:glutathione S-transferase
MQVYHVGRTRSLRVVWMAEEMGVALEVLKASFPPTDPAFLAANPTATLPLFLDGPVVMTESIAILQYMAARHGPTDLAVATDEAGFPDYLQFLEVGEATLATPLTATIRTRFMAPADQKNNWTVENCREVYVDRLKLVDAQLAKGDHMAAGRFTAADISVGYALGFGEGLKLDGAFSPRVAAYWERLKQRPAYQRAIAR